MLTPVIAVLTALAGPLAPQDLRGEIEVPHPRCLALSPAGDLWLGSADGGLYASRDRGRSWSAIETPARGPDEYGFGEDRFEHVGFFDAGHAVVSGYVGDDEEKEILRTEDGGATWSLVTLPHELWVYDMQVSPDGRAWLVGSTGDLLASDDFGATWRIAGEPFDARRRSSSVWFASPDVGVVGSNHNGIRLTTDGGGVWHDVGTPVGELSSSVAGPSHSVERVWILGERIFALQDQRLYRHPLGVDGGWTPVEHEGRAIVAAEAALGGLVAITADRRVVEVSATLSTRSLAGAALGRMPIAIARDERGCAFLLARARVCLLEEGRLECSNLYSKDRDRSWPIAAFDRSSDGTLFGTSSTALYRSTDSGATWERLAERDGMGGTDGYAGGSGVAAFADGSGAVVVTREGLAAWTAERSTLETVLEQGAHEQRLSILARRGGLWVAASFEADGARAEGMLRMSDTVRRGPGFTALVYASADEGRSWSEVDRRAGAIVHALWLGADDVVHLCLSDGTLRAGKLDAVTGAPDGDGFQDVASEPKGLGGQWASWLAFPEPNEGVVGGNFYFAEGVVHRSRDGGRTWSASEAVEGLVIDAYRLGGGACVRVVGFWDEVSRVDLWRDGDFHELRGFLDGVHDARVDAAGRLLVRLADGAVWSLSADARDWSRLGVIALPPR